MTKCNINAGSQTPGRPIARDDQICRRTTNSLGVRRPADDQEIHISLCDKMEGRPDLLEGRLTFSNRVSFRRPRYQHESGTLNMQCYSNIPSILHGPVLLFFLTKNKK